MKRVFKIENCVKNLLQTIIKQMVVVDKYVNIRITKDFVDSSSYLPAKDLIKYMKVENSKLFTNSYTLDKPVRMSFIAGSKLLILLSQFENDDTIDIEISYDSNTEADEYYAMKVVMIGRSLSISEVCADQRFDTINIKPIPDETLKRLLDTSNCQLCFDITKDNMKAIKSLGNIERDNKRFEYVIENGVLSIRERNDIEDEESVIYNKIISYVTAPDNVYICNKNVFSSINNVADYGVCICESDTINKVVYTHDESGVILNIIASV